MKGYGEWLQLSAFQCRLTPIQHAELIALLDAMIHHPEDHVILLALGVADKVVPRIVSLGKSDFTPIEHEPVIV